MTGELDLAKVGIDSDKVAKQIAAKDESRRAMSQASPYSRSQDERHFQQIKDKDTKPIDRLRATAIISQLGSLVINDFLTEPDKYGVSIVFELPQDVRRLTFAVAEKTHLEMGFVELKTIGSDLEENEVLVEAMSVGQKLLNEDRNFPARLDLANKFFFDCVQKLRKRRFKVEAQIRVGYGVKRDEKLFFARNVVDIVIKRPAVDRPPLYVSMNSGKLLELLKEQGPIHISEVHQTLRKQMTEWNPPEPFEKSFNYYQNLGFELPKVSLEPSISPDKQEQTLETVKKEENMK